MRPEFLRLPNVTAKPRKIGLTHVLDKGLPVEAMASVLASYAEFADVWKFGWGTSYTERRLAEKIALLDEHGVISCLGGTLLEIAWAQGMSAECLAWAKASGFMAVEVSRGTVAMGIDEKQALIRRAAEDFVVFAETGYKSADRVLLPHEWHEELVQDLQSGADYVVAEGRESGNVGLYDSSGKPQLEIIDAAIGAAGIGRTLFEAPRKDQQAWFIRTHGSDVNLGNIAPDDILPMQTLRLGLRADTACLSTGEPASTGSPA